MNTIKTLPSNNKLIIATGAGVALTLILASIADWPWMAKFLETSAPAWIQAIGSVAAIFAAALIVQRQHALEMQRTRSAETLGQQRRARALRIVFFSAARTCEDVGCRIGRPYQTWNLLSKELLDARARLLSIDPMLVPGGGLLLLVEECAMRLQTSATLVNELQTPRPAKVQETVRIAVMAASRECWLGLHEATDLEIKLSKGKYDDSEPYSFDDFEESRNSLDMIRAEFVQNKNSIQNTEST